MNFERLLGYKFSKTTVKTVWMFFKFVPHFVFAALIYTFFERLEQLFSMFHLIWCLFSLFSKVHDTAPLTQRTRKDWSFFLLVSHV